LAGAEREPHVQLDADEACRNMCVVRGRDPQALAEETRGNASPCGSAPLVVIERARRERMRRRARSLEQRADRIEIGRDWKQSANLDAGPEGRLVRRGLENRVVAGITERQRSRTGELEQRLRLRNVGGCDANREAPVAQPLSRLI